VNAGQAQGGQVKTQQLRRKAFLIFTVFAGLVLAGFAVPAAYADTLDLGAASNFVIYGYGSAFTNLDNPGAVFINGNVGIGTGGAVNIGGTNVNISGDIFFADANANSTSQFVVGNGADHIGGAACTSTATCLATGNVIFSNANALNAEAAVNNLYNTSRVLATTAGSPSGALSSNFTWTGNGGTNVASLSSLTLSAGSTLTLKGGAGDIFILNITGNFMGSSGGSIVLDGISPDQVLFNMICTGASQSCNSSDINEPAVSFSGSFVGAGIVLGLDSDITQDTPGGGWTGRFFGDTDETIKLFSEATITQPTTTTTVPEPSSVALLGAGIFGLLGFARRKSDS
jgi:PEP-CTERM motif-containing protein